MATSTVRIVFDAAAIQSQILRAPGTRSLIAGLTSGIAMRAGEGMQSSVTAGRDRWRGMVWTGTPLGRQREADERALTRAVGQ